MISKHFMPNLNHASRVSIVIDRCDLTRVGFLLAMIRNAVVIAIVALFATGCKPMSWGQKLGFNRAPESNLTKRDSVQVTSTPSLWQRMFGIDENAEKSDLTPDNSSVELDDSESDSATETQIAAAKTNKKPRTAASRNLPAAKASESYEDLLAGVPEEHRQIIQDQIAAMRQLELDRKPATTDSKSENSAQGSTIVALPSTASGNLTDSSVKTASLSGADQSTKVENVASVSPVAPAPQPPQGALPNLPINSVAGIGPTPAVPTNASLPATSASPNGAPALPVNAVLPANATANAMTPNATLPAVNLPGNNTAPTASAPVLPSAAQNTVPASTVSYRLNDSSTPSLPNTSLQNATSSQSGGTVGLASNNPAAGFSPSEADSKSWLLSLQEATIKLENYLKENPQLPENDRVYHEAALRTMYAAQLRLDDSMRSIDVLQPAEQQYFQHQLQALHTAINPKGMPVRDRRWGEVMLSQQRADQQLASLAALDLRSVNFCKAVRSFADIEKFTIDEFKARQEVLLYCELNNFTSQPLKTGFETEFAGEYEIFNSADEKIDSKTLPVDRQTCSTLRRDYFIAYRMYMPKNITPGKYRLELTIQDVKGRKFGQSTVHFTIVE